MKRGTKPIAEYARAFKTICDQLNTIGRLVEDIDKVHWLLRGLDTDFLAFSTSHDASHPYPLFCRFSL